MRRPNHIILDFETSSTSNSPQYWAVDFLFDKTKTPQFLNDLDISKKYKPHLKSKNTLNLFKETQKFTIKPGYTHHASRLKSWEQDGVTAIFKPTPPASDKSAKHVMKYSQDAGRDAYMYLTLSPDQYCARTLKCLHVKYNTQAHLRRPSALNTVNSLVNINFLRKERLYTKLKYSRSPAYDIVSGGAAALLAGFLGFLISEKFGYELVDSGDFYYLFMYLVFLSFSIRPLLVTSDASKGFIDSFSLRRTCKFYMHILQAFMRLFK